jgi:hypothetical protein
MTDANTEKLWLAFGNPTSLAPRFRFRQCFPGGRDCGRWRARHIDSRTARMSNKAAIEGMISYYGLDSDFVRVRVLGQFPRAGSLQFIPSDLVEAAADPNKEVPTGLYDPFVMAVDVARFGDDRSVVRFRRGRDARSIPAIKYRGLDTMQLAARVANLYEHHKPDGLFVDGGGVGAGVVDRLRALRVPVIEVQFGAKADRDQIGQSGTIAANKRAEMYAVMRDWLRGGIIDDDPELKADLTNVQYSYVVKDGRDCVILERKTDMKRRGLASPDDADALALTFAFPVQPSDHSATFARKGGGNEYDNYDPLPMMKR